MKKLHRLPLVISLMLILGTVAFADVASGFMVSVFAMIFGIPAVILVVIALLVCYFTRRKK